MELEKSDYTAVRDTPTGWLDNFSMLKFAFSISSNVTRLVQPIPMRSRKNAWNLQTWLVKFLPKWGKSTGNDQNVINWKGSQDTSTCQIASHSSHAFWRKLPETPNLTCFTKSKWCQKRKINRPWPKFNKFWRWSGYISMTKFRPFLHCVLQKMSGSYKFGLFHLVKMMPKWEKSTDDDPNFISSEVVRIHQHVKFQAIQSDCNINSGLW